MAHAFEFLIQNKHILITHYSNNSKGLEYLLYADKSIFDNSVTGSDLTQDRQ